MQYACMRCACEREFVSANIDIFLPAEATLLACLKVGMVNSISIIDQRSNYETN